MVRILRRWLGKRQWHREEKGLALVESLVAVAILGTAVITMIISLATGSLAVRETDQEVVAQRLARTQLEYLKGYPYDPDATTYPAVVAPSGYSISVGVAATPDASPGIQKITANISRDGEPLLTVEDYKVNR